MVSPAGSRLAGREPPRRLGAGSAPRWSASRAARSASTKSTTEPESASPYSSSGPVHHAFSGTTTAPAAVAPQKASDHSGKLRMAMATRSPGCTPKRSRSVVARCAAARRSARRTSWCSSSYTRNTRSPWARLASSTSRRPAGACFHVRVGMPRITTSSISNGWPGAVRAACTSAIVGLMVGQHARTPGPPATPSHLRGFGAAGGRQTTSDPVRVASRGLSAAGGRQTTSDAVRVPCGMVIDTLLAEAQALQGEAVRFRRVLHEHPEVGLELPFAQAQVLEALDGLPLTISTGDSTTSVVATLEGAHPGPTILLRGDMDALPMPEDTGLDFSSRRSTAPCTPAGTTPTPRCSSVRPSCWPPAATSWPAGCCSCSSPARRATTAPGSCSRRGCSTSARSPTAGRARCRAPSTCTSRRCSRRHRQRCGAAR